MTKSTTTGFKDDPVPKLQWTLAICTYNRPHFLRETLRHALAQSRPPAEIVVVDASDGWANHRDLVLEQFADQWDRVRLIYAEADVRSLTCQRNQAMGLATSEIVFSLDDDIYLYETAAAQIMGIYDTDTAKDIAMVAGQFTVGPPQAPTPTPDPALASAAVPDHPSPSPMPMPTPQSLRSKLRGWLENQMTLDGHFVPYGPPVERGPLPAAAQAAGASAGGLINGGRTTVRRDLAVQTGWSEMLRYYATHEDSDFSYRMSRLGRLTHATTAGFFHADGNESTASRYRINTIRVRNLMALHAIHSDNRLRSAGRLALSFLKFALLYALIDPVQKRFSLPTMRAYLFGLIQIPVFLFWPFEDFSAWYIRLQEKMYGTRYKS